MADHWKEFRRLVESHGLPLSKVVSGLTCYLENNEDEYGADIVTALNRFSWVVGDDMG